MVKVNYDEMTVFYSKSMVDKVKKINDTFEGKFLSVEKSKEIMTRDCLVLRDMNSDDFVVIYESSTFGIEKLLEGIELGKKLYSGEDIIDVLIS
jgi:hypothetical protein